VLDKNRAPFRRSLTHVKLVDGRKFLAVDFDVYKEPVHDFGDDRVLEGFLSRVKRGELLEIRNISVR
jgi:hypothetical protein